MADEIFESVPQPVEQPASPVVTPVAPATPTPAQQLIDEYEIEQESPEEAAFVASPEPAVITPPPAPSPSHPRYLIAQALDLGVPQADIDRASTDDLGAFVADQNRRILQSVREQQRSQAQEAARGQGATTSPPSASIPVGGASATAGATTTEEEFSLGPNEQDFAPEIVGALKRVWGVVSEVKKQLAEARAKLDGYEQVEQRRQTETLTERADRAFSRHKTILGEKRRDELDAASPEYQRRLAILTLVSRDNSSKTLEQKIDGAVALLFGAGASGQVVTGDIAPPRPTASNARPKRPDGTFMSNDEILAERWRAGALERPTQRAGAPEPNGQAKAEKAVASKLREIEGEPGGAGFNIDEEFPE